MFNTLVTSLKSRDELEQMLVEGFAKEKAGFVTYSMKVLPLKFDQPKRQLVLKAKSRPVNATECTQAMMLVRALRVVQEEQKPADPAAPATNPPVAEITSIPQEPTAPATGTR